jgi:hypothetical protein
LEVSVLKLIAFLLFSAGAAVAQDVTIQITLSQAEYQALAETLPDMKRAVVTPAPPNPDGSPQLNPDRSPKFTRTEVPRYSSVEDMIQTLLGQQLKVILTEHPNSLTQAAKDAAQVQQQVADEAAQAKSLNVVKK